MNNTNCTPSKLDEVVRTHPAETILAAIGTGIVIGVVARILHNRATEPTSMEAAMEAVRGAGGRVRDIFR